MKPLVLKSRSAISEIGKDDFLILSASWEKRCLGLIKYLESYKCEQILLTIYDGHNEERSKNINILTTALQKVGEIVKIPALHENPLVNVRDTIEIIKKRDSRSIKLAMDISCYTRKHFLQLLQGLDTYGLLENVNFYYTEPEDYFTNDNEPYSKGISSVKVINSYAGNNFASKDRVLIIFLGYEGNRALALWEHLSHNVTIAIIPDPPFKKNWEGRTETQNSYLLSTLSNENIFKSDSLEPKSTVTLLSSLFDGSKLDFDKYNFFIAPLGTKAQTLGLFRFYRKHKEALSIVYASPFKYKNDSTIFNPGRTWLIDKSSEWDD